MQVLPGPAAHYARRLLAQTSGRKSRGVACESEGNWGMVRCTPWVSHGQIRKRFRNDSINRINHVCCLWAELNIFKYAQIFQALGFLGGSKIWCIILGLRKVTKTSKALIHRAKDIATVTMGKLSWIRKLWIHFDGFWFFTCSGLLQLDFSQRNTSWSQGQGFGIFWEKRQPTTPTDLTMGGWLVNRSIILK